MLSVEYATVEVVFYIVVVVAGVTLRYPVDRAAVHVVAWFEYRGWLVRPVRLVVVRVLGRLVCRHLDVIVCRDIVAVATVDVCAGSSREGGVGTSHCAGWC